MPPKNDYSLLFHPKKNKKPVLPPPRASPTKPRPVPPPAPKEDEDALKLPDVPYTDYPLLSSALNGWKYDVMKFDSRKPVDVLQWTAPIKLNRKDLRRDDKAAAASTSAPQAVKPMLGPDGKPVIGADGRIVMVDAEGKPIHPSDGSAAANGKDKGKANAGRKRFQKKTRQVHLVPDEVRQLQKEERYPWVIEDSDPARKELWIGQLEDVSKAETHAFLMPAANDAFKFVPSHRWYKFQKKLKHELPTDTANVEALYSKTQKKDPQAWLATLNGGRGASASTTAMFKQEEKKPDIFGSTSYGPGGRRLKTVDKGMDPLFDDDDEGESKRRRDKDLGEDGDLDEQPFEEDFADDDEAIPADGEDEEAKEAEERLKKEYRMANKHRDAGVDEDEEEDGPKVSKSGKALQRMIRNREGNDAYESDEEKNPYASSEEEEEEEESVPSGPAIQPQPQQVDNSRSNTPKPSGSTPKPLVTSNNSRANSPVASPSHGGHSLLAKRATSPKPPKPKVPGVNSPPGSRQTSPAPSSRATSPLAGSSTDRPNNKRKADDSSATNGGPVKQKKKKVVAPASAAELEALLIDWLRRTPDATTRDCIQHFNAYLTDQEKKAEFSAMVKRVAVLKNQVLALRPSLLAA